MLYVLYKDVLEVESLNVSFDQIDPVHPHVDVSGVVSRQLVKLQRNLFYLFEEALDEYFFMLLLNVALQLDVDEEIPTLLGYDSLLTLNRDRPKRLNTQQVLEVDDIHNFK